MKQSAAYYTGSLYPFQDRILKAVSETSVPFYLTGGTALSRFYLNHRYSDDLDLFVNNDCNFQSYIRTVEDHLAKDYGILPDLKSMVDSPETGFHGAFYTDPETGLQMKIDMVNDVAFHVGALKHSEVYPRIDSIENILSNKISALVGRSEIKDAVDLRGICRKYSFSWKKIINDALQKEAGVDIELICGLLSSIKEEHLKDIVWVRHPDFNTFKTDISKICADMLKLKDNSLVPKRTRGMFER